MSLAAGIAGHQRDRSARRSSSRVQSGFPARGTAVRAAPQGPEPRGVGRSEHQSADAEEGKDDPRVCFQATPHRNMSPPSPARPPTPSSSPRALSIGITLPAEPGLQPGSRVWAPWTAVPDCPAWGRAAGVWRHRICPRLEATGIGSAPAVAPRRWGAAPALCTCVPRASTLSHPRGSDLHTLYFF